jgi:hypothetical protein
VASVAVFSGLRQEEIFGGGLPDESGCERHTGFAFVKNKHGPCALASKDEVVTMRDKK